MEDGATDKRWYYAVGGTERKGPIRESELRELIEQGQLSGGDLVWTEGMPAWAPLESRSEFQPPVTPEAAVPEVRTGVPAGLGGWMTFVGVVSMVSGALTCLTCIGLPIGILMIVAGVAALEAAGLVRELPDTDPAVAPLLAKFRTYFLTTGWIFILHLVLTGLLIATSAGAIVAFLVRAVHQLD